MDPWGLGRLADVAVVVPSWPALSLSLSWQASWGQLGMKGRAGSQSCLDPRGTPRLQQGPQKLKAAGRLDLKPKSPGSVPRVGTVISGCPLSSHLSMHPCLPSSSPGCVLGSGDGNSLATARPMETKWPRQRDTPQVDGPRVPWEALPVQEESSVLSWGKGLSAC